MNNQELIDKYKNGDEISIERQAYISIKQLVLLEYGEKYEKSPDDKICELLKEFDVKDKKLSSQAEANSLVEYCKSRIAKEQNNSDPNYDPWRGKCEKFIKVLAGYRYNPNQKILQELLDFASKINNDPLRFIFEIIQNADDCDYDKTVTPELTMTIVKENDKSKLQFEYPEKGMTSKDIIAITTIGEGNKRDRKRKKLVGEKGIGFKTIFAACDAVEIHSNREENGEVKGYHFLLNSLKEEGSGFIPSVIEQKSEQPGTKMIMDLKNRDWKTLITEKFGVDLENKEINWEKAFSNCPVLFTNKIKKMTIKEIKNGNESFLFSVESIDNYIKYKMSEDGNEWKELELYRVDRNIKFSYEQFNERYQEQYKPEEYEKQLNGENSDILTYKISVVAPKNPDLGIKTGNMYSFFPTYTKINAPFSMNLPLKLNIDRSCMWFYTNQDTNAENVYDNVNEKDTLRWNKAVFERLFCKIEDKESILQEFYKCLKENEAYKYIPVFDDNKCIFIADSDYKTDKKEEFNTSINYLNELLEKNYKLFEKFESMKYWFDGSNWLSTDHIIMFDKFISSQMGMSERMSEAFKWKYCDYKGISMTNLFLINYSEEILKKIVAFENRITYILPDLSELFGKDDKESFDWINDYIKRSCMQENLVKLLFGDESCGRKNCIKEKNTLYSVLCDNGKYGFLKIFKAGRGNKDVLMYEYQSLKDGFWFWCGNLDKIDCTNSAVISTDSINFIITNDKNDEMLKKIESYITKIDDKHNKAVDISKEVYNVIKDKLIKKECSTDDVDLFKMLVDFRRNNDENHKSDNWFAYFKDVILKEKGDESEIIRLMVKVLETQLMALQDGEYRKVAVRTND